jgi:hypothetical protein
MYEGSVTGLAANAAVWWLPGENPLVRLWLSNTYTIESIGTSRLLRITCGAEDVATNPYQGTSDSLIEHGSSNSHPLRAGCVQKFCSPWRIVSAVHFYGWVENVPNKSHPLIRWLMFEVVEVQGDVRKR